MPFPYWNRLNLHIQLIFHWTFLWTKISFRRFSPYAVFFNPFQMIFFFYNSSRYLIVNQPKRRCLSSLSPHSGDDAINTHLTPIRKRDILRTLYKYVVSVCTTGPVSSGKYLGKSSQSVLRSTNFAFSDSDDKNPDVHKPREMFMNFQFYKCHAIINDIYLMLVLYPVGLPNHYIRWNQLNVILISSWDDNHLFLFRSISQNTLKILTCEKSCKW